MAKMTKNSLALTKRYDRLAPIWSWEVRQGKLRFFRATLPGGTVPSRGVSVHGPHSASRHLADYIRQRVLLHRQDVVVTNGSFCGCRWHRPSLHCDFCADGDCVRCGATNPGIPCLEV